MRIEKRTIVMQIVMFTFFFFFGLNYILKELIVDNNLYDTLALVFLGLVIVAGLIWFFATKKDELISAEQPFLNQTKWLLYIVAGSLLLGIVSAFFPAGNDISKYILVSSGAFMSITSLFGIFISVRAFLNNEE
jgi:hypothetical protein